MERVLDVDFPVVAEGLPGVLVQRSAEWPGTGYQRKNPRPVSVDQLPGGRRVSCVGRYRREPLAQLSLQLVQARCLPGDADDVRARLMQCRCDASAQATASASDDCVRAGELLGGHAVPPWCMGGVPMVSEV